MDIWTFAERKALEANSLEAEKALADLGVVSALEPTDQGKDGYSVVLCNTERC